MKDIQQLIKRDNQEGKYKDIFPQTYIEAISDKQTGVGLDQILNSFNMYFLSYQGNAQSTRLQVIDKLRRKGLWITYVTLENKIVTEWYNSDDITDSAWGSNSNWMQGSNMLVGDISISSSGTWVVDGVDTGIKAQGPKGEKGEEGKQGKQGPNGLTPTVRAKASISNNVIGTPSVNVTEEGTELNKIFNFIFSNLRGGTGPQGNQGIQGPEGQSAAAVKKTYASISAMKADMNPTNGNGEPLNVGDAVSIYNEEDDADVDNNKLYAWQKTGSADTNWILIGKINQVDRELNKDSVNPIENGIVSKNIFAIDKLTKELDNLNGKNETISDLDIIDEKGSVLCRLKEGHIQTKEFNSKNIKQFTIENNQLKIR